MLQASFGAFFPCRRKNTLEEKAKMNAVFLQIRTDIPKWVILNSMKASYFESLLKKGAKLLVLFRQNHHDPLHMLTCQVSRWMKSHCLFLLRV